MACVEQVCERGLDHTWVSHLYAMLCLLVLTYCRCGPKSRHIYLTVTMYNVHSQLNVHCSLVEFFNIESHHMYIERWLIIIDNGSVREGPN